MQAEFCDGVFFLDDIHQHYGRLKILTGGTAAAQASDSLADSSLPPSAPAAAMSPPSGAAPPDAPRSPGNTLASRDDPLVSCDTDMASSAVVAAAGERVSPFYRGRGRWRE